jgi:hypothetical protein
VLSGFYAMHTEADLDELCRSWLWRKPWERQPLDHVAEYFGEEVAFYFSWLGFYTRWLLYSAPLGLVLFITGHAVPQDGGWSSTVYSFFIALWAAFFLEFWKREQNSKAYSWNMVDFEDEERVRPEYHGEDVPGVWRMGVFVNLSKFKPPPPPIKHYSTGYTKLKMLCSFSVIAILAMVVIIATVAILSFRLFVQRRLLEKDVPFGSSIGGIVGSVGNAIFIMILNKIYRYIAGILTDWENHRTVQTYNNNLAIKIFLFTFVNTFTALFYIAYFKRNMSLWGVGSLKDICTETSSSSQTQAIWRGCPGDLYQQLSSLLIFNLLVGQAIEVAVPFLMPVIGRFMIYRRIKERKSESKSKCNWLGRQCGYACSFFCSRNIAKYGDREIADYEKQGTLNTSPGLIDEYSEMVLQFGLVTIFAASFPLASLIALINNMVEMRTDAFKFVKLYAKPNWVGANGIGIWYDILFIIAIIAVVNNCLLVGFAYTPIRTVISTAYATYEEFHINYYVLWTILLLEHFILLLKFSISVLIPDVPSYITKRVALGYYLKQLKLKKKEDAVDVQIFAARSSKLAEEQRLEAEQFAATHAKPAPTGTPAASYDAPAAVVIS